MRGRGRRIGVGDVTTISGIVVAPSSCAWAIPLQSPIGIIAAPDSKSARVYFNISLNPCPVVAPFRAAMNARVTTADERTGGRAGGRQFESGGRR